MSKKRDAQNWYQVHKRQAGEESVKRSWEVASARREAEALEADLERLRAGYHPSTLAKLRMAMLGPNSLEKEILAAEQKVNSARAKVGSAMREAAKRGEVAYGKDWASRNPGKAKY